MTYMVYIGPFLAVIIYLAYFGSLGRGRHCINGIFWTFFGQALYRWPILALKARHHIYGIFCSFFGRQHINGIFVFTLFQTVQLLNQQHPPHKTYTIKHFYLFQSVTLFFFFLFSHLAYLGLSSTLHQSNLLNQTI